MVSDIHLLVDQCRSGDGTAIGQFIDLFRNKVYGLCYRMVGEHHEAEDMAQETFVRVMRSLDHWDRERPLEPWILTIAGNRCRTLLAKRKRRPQAHPIEDHVADHRPDLQPAQILAEEVHLALQQVRSEYRQAFLLFHEHELSYIEISEQLGKPLGTIKTWVHRARREMIARLSQRGVLEGRENEMRRV
ncbi:RNA polymerase sigma factor [Blastopirellula retiformator]|uniref:ECF RNA polymerase sigma factor SigW n=1 Tax=Blastopirellula retiformator TaxID=2527970 RepID=A0A5C5VN34_9BACT|nr:sigma-70 family RNA polymerase sigma factor [Blastopirellula retiformator]TWT39305.1 ECF RNA polymerase sigma factor SigW [Blastopirellula retiformator]